MDLFEQLAAHEYEKVLYAYDKPSGLKAIICIHNTLLGPALGGTRMWAYKTEADALTDVLRLARAMTYKSAGAGLDFGGGKAVIIGDPHKDKSEALFRAYGRAVDALGGKYVTCEDVGTMPADLEIVMKETRYLTGRPLSMGGSGDSAPATGLGVFRGMQACAIKVWGSESLKGKKVAIQGFGKVAYYLAKNLVKEGASIMVTDINQEAVARAKNEFGATILMPEEIYHADCDIFAPCALGGVLNDLTIPRLRCKIICGGANNQLLEDRHAEAVERLGMLYAPDFIVNAGGVINLAQEVAPDGYSEKLATARVLKIYDNMNQVLNIASAQHITTAQAANRLAEQRIERAKAEKARR